MPTYPTLTINPSEPMGVKPEDSTIKSDFEAGYMQTRSRFTRKRKTFNIVYDLISDADKNTLEAFVETVKEGSLSFDWTEPLTSTVYVVRFQIAPEYETVIYGYWKTSFVLEEV